MLKTTQPALGDLRQTPWSMPSFSSFYRGIRRQMLPDLPLQMTSIPLPRTVSCCFSLPQNGRFRTWESVLPLGFHALHQTQGAFLAVLPSLPCPKAARISAAPRNGPGPSRGGAVCLLPSAKPGQAPSCTHPFGSNRMPSEPLLPLLGPGMWTQGAIQCKCLFTLVGMQREQFATNLSVETHISRIVSEHRASCLGFAAFLRLPCCRG